jgi:RHS repeat-associated protein
LTTYSRADGATRPGPAWLQRRREKPRECRTPGAAALGQAQVQAQAETMGRALFTAQVTDMSITNTQYVTNLYEGFLQRGPDSGGLSFWVGQAARSRQNVLNAFAVSGTFQELAGTLYREAFWLVSDHLGTPRMIVDKSGSLAGVKRNDYLPFGEELYANTGGRTTAQGYGGDSVRQKFTQKERDNETNLDWFGPGRYYSSTQGRFTSVDPGGTGAQAVNPQSLNRYTYTLNRPTIAIDPDGLSTIVVTVTVPAGGGNPTASIIFYGQLGDGGALMSVRYDGLAAGQGRDRMVQYNDTPYGTYSFDGTQGGTAETRLDPGFGTGKIIITGLSGEIIESGRSLIRLHGGGTVLGDHAYDLQQELRPTQGCVRMHNGDVNELIGLTRTAAANNDPLDRVFIGSAEALNTTANETNRSGNYVNPDLRLAIGMYSNEQQRQALITADANRRAEVQRQREEQQRQLQERQRQRQQRRHPENQ